MTVSPDSLNDSAVSAPESTSHLADGTSVTPFAASRRLCDIAPSNGVISLVSPREMAQSLSTVSTAKAEGAYELKFLIDENRADRIIEWARNHLSPDPHASSLPTFCWVCPVRDFP